MTEEFLHYIWKYALYDPSTLKTDTGEPISILKLGEHNSNAGPDFLNSKLKIGETIWAGDVEIHINSSDWHRHKHHTDKAYNSVILHIVYKNDEDSRLQNGVKIPTLELKFEMQLFHHYLQLINSSNKWIACAEDIKKIEPFTYFYWLETLTIERLHEKSETIFSTLRNVKNDWSETFYIHLARNFGFKVNSDPFEMLARTLPLKFLAKHKDNLIQVEALFYGQAGFLNDDFDDVYYKTLVREYNLLRSKFDLKPLEKHVWKFLRLRPDNFPTIRISQFAVLLHKSSFLFTKIIETKSIKYLQKFFQINASSYWNTHYQFGNKSINEREKTFGIASFYNLVINTIAPFLFLYGSESGKEELKDRSLNFLVKTPPEENAIIRNWGKLGFYPKNAFETQGMLQLKNNYCFKRRCLHCQVGNKIISSSQT